MKKDTSTTATKNRTNLLLFVALGILLVAAFNLDPWWLWALTVAALAAGVVAFIVHVRRRAQDGLDLLAATDRSLDSGTDRWSVANAGRARV